MTLVQAEILLCFVYFLKENIFLACKISISNKFLNWKSSFLFLMVAVTILLRQKGDQEQWDKWQQSGIGHIHCFFYVFYWKVWAHTLLQEETRTNSHYRHQTTTTDKTTGIRIIKCDLSTPDIEIPPNHWPRLMVYGALDAVKALNCNNLVEYRLLVEFLFEIPKLLQWISHHDMLRILGILSMFYMINRFI